MAKGFDCATPLTAQIAAMFAEDGFEFVARYLVPSGYKRLTAEEAAAISQTGMRVISVFETTADRALSGRATGLEDGAIAQQTAEAIGQPAGSAIYFAVDFDATASQMAAVVEYIRGASEATPGYPTGVYGSYAVMEAVDAAGACSHFWQTYAWSGGKTSSHNNIYQYQNDIAVNGIGIDMNDSYGNEGWWQTQAATEEDEDNMPMKLEQWQWDMLYTVFGKAYNDGKLQWSWMQKIVDKTMTASECAFLNTVLDGRIDRNIEV